MAFAVPSAENSKWRNSILRYEICGPAFFSLLQLVQSFRYLLKRKRRKKKKIPSKQKSLIIKLVKVFHQKGKLVTDTERKCGVIKMPAVTSQINCSIELRTLLVKFGKNICIANCPSLIAPRAASIARHNMANFKVAVVSGFCLHWWNVNRKWNLSHP